MSDNKESLHATVASLRRAARDLIASIDTTSDRAQKRLLASQAFELLRQSVQFAQQFELLRQSVQLAQQFELLRQAAQLAQQEENARSNSTAPPIPHPKKADTHTGALPTRRPHLRSSDLPNCSKDGPFPVDVTIPGARGCAQKQGADGRSPLRNEFSARKRRISAIA